MVNILGSDIRASAAYNSPQIAINSKCNMLTLTHMQPSVNRMYMKPNISLASYGFQDGWVGFKAVVLKKPISAGDFYNGYMHASLTGKPSHQPEECVFVSHRTQASTCRELDTTA